jgi:hypothetical protein
MRRSTSNAARAAFVSDPSRDPIGIVIADGGPGDRAPRFSAFVWGPVPDEEMEDEGPVAPLVANLALPEHAPEALVCA